MFNFALEARKGRLAQITSENTRYKYCNINSGTETYSCWVRSFVDKHAGCAWQIACPGYSVNELAPRCAVMDNCYSPYRQEYIQKNVDRMWFHWLSPLPYWLALAAKWQTTMQMPLLAAQRHENPEPCNGGSIADRLAALGPIWAEHPGRSCRAQSSQIINWPKPGQWVWPTPPKNMDKSACKALCLSVGQCTAIEYDSGVGGPTCTMFDMLTPAVATPAHSLGMLTTCSIIIGWNPPQARLEAPTAGKMGGGRILAEGANATTIRDNSAIV